MHRLETPEPDAMQVEPRPETVGDLLMDIRVSVSLMSEKSEARRTLIRCAMALVHLGRNVEGLAKALHEAQARAEAAEQRLVDL